MTKTKPETMWTVFLPSGEACVSMLADTREEAIRRWHDYCANEEERPAEGAPVNTSEWRKAKREGWRCGRAKLVAA